VEDVPVVIVENIQAGPGIFHDIAEKGKGAFFRGNKGQGGMEGARRFVDGGGGCGQERFQTGQIVCLYGFQKRGHDGFSFHYG
jgi:hypothetical protein